MKRREWLRGIMTCAPQKCHPNRCSGCKQENLVRLLFPFLIGRLLMDCCQFAKLAMKSRAALAAETLFLRKQLALYSGAEGEASSNIGGGSLENIDSFGPLV